VVELTLELGRFRDAQNSYGRHRRLVTTHFWGRRLGV
jgi:hypothetical protein